MSGKIAVVTGGAGFLGSHLVEELCKIGWRVRVIDDLSTGRLKNLSSVKNQVEFRRASITNRDIVSKILSGADSVFHLAAKISVVESYKEPELYIRVNIIGLTNVLEESKNKGVRRLIFPSSAAIYEEKGPHIKTEKSPLKPYSPYAVTKILGEALCRTYYENHNLETVILRIFNIYGSRQNPCSPYSSVIPKFLFSFKHGLRPVIYGDGKQTRDFIHVKDVVKAMILATKKKNAAGEVLNLASGKATSILDLYKTMKSVSGWKLKPMFLNERVGEIKHSRASIAKARKILGYNPTISIRNGLKQMIEEL